MVTSGFLSQKASNMENVSMPCSHWDHMIYNHLPIWSHEDKNMGLFTTWLHLSSHFKPPCNCTTCVFHTLCFKPNDCFLICFPSYFSYIDYHLPISGQAVFTILPRNISIDWVMGCPNRTVLCDSVSGVLLITSRATWNDFCHRVPLWQNYYNDRA